MFLGRHINFYPDGLFFLLIGIACVICVGLYFLIPLIKHKQYEQQRADLRKREEAFKKSKAGQTLSNYNEASAEKVVNE